VLSFMRRWSAAFEIYNDASAVEDESDDCDIITQPSCLTTDDYSDDDDEVFETGRPAGLAKKHHRLTPS